MASNLLVLDEPRLLFNHEQATEDPRDGLTLFGPLDRVKPYGIRYGVVGTPDGVKYLHEWVSRCQRPVAPPEPDPARPIFPGFQAAFGIPWSPNPVYKATVDSTELHRRIRYDDRHMRVYSAVDLYAEAILSTTLSEDAPVDLWFFIEPDDVARFCRPQSTVGAFERIEATPHLSKNEKETIRAGQSLMFAPPGTDEIRKAYDYEVNFHNQLKARLLEKRLVTQILRESTIAHEKVLRENGKPLRDMSKMLVDVAWHIATAAFYKSGGRPWKISGMREGVCYIGVVFKQDERAKDRRTACCAAQMFLDSGDGVVFKGNNGPWYTGRFGEFHLDEHAAKDLISRAVETYRTKKKLNGEADRPPRELFVHARTRFSDEEWRGFCAAAGKETNVVAVQIQEEHDLKLYRPGTHAVLRCSALPIDRFSGYLWTRGLVPRLRTYVGKEVPNPLLVRVSRGQADIEVVLQDILGLTKLNYNACRFADGEPVTLKFADAVGEILTAGPIENLNVPPLPFKHYI
jgi:hypothetical protein